MHTITSQRNATIWMCIGGESSHRAPRPTKTRSETTRRRLMNDARMESALTKIAVDLLQRSFGINLGLLGCRWPHHQTFAR